MTRKVIKVVLIGHQKLFRLGMAALLARSQDIRVVGDTGQPELAIQLAVKTHPDVVLLDMPLAEGHDLDPIKSLHQKFPALRILILTTQSNPDSVRAALNAGASGYLMKSIDQSELEGAIRAVVAGGLYLSTSLPTQLITSVSLIPPAETFGLTARQREILELVAKGCSQKEIGYRLGISVKTVEAHRKQLMQRLGFHDVASLVKFAVKKGLTSLE